MAESVVTTPGFVRELKSFAQQERDLILKAVNMLMINPDGGGLNPEYVKANRNYMTFRATQGIRIVGCRTKGCLQLVGVDRHDNAYKRVAAGSFATPSNIPEMAERLSADALDPKRRAMPTSGPLVHFSDNELIAKFAIPEDWVGAVRSVNDAESLWSIGIANVLPEDNFFALLTIFPEVPVISTGDKPIFRFPDEALAKAFADGEIKELQFNLPAASWSIIESTRRAPILVKGGPGSGKTLVALYRALHVLEDRGLGLEVAPRVLYVTYTNQLRDDARNKVERLRGKIPENLAIETYDHFAVRYGAKKDHRIEYDVANLLPYVLTAAKGTSMDTSFAQSEIVSIIEARNVRTLEEYQKLRRHGRGAALGPKGRATIWGIYERYRNELEKNRLADIGIARMAACDSTKNVSTTEQFDFVIVDEVQDLQASALKMMVHLTRGKGTAKHLMLVGDAGQTIHSRGFSWAAVDLSIGGGNVHSLGQSERSTQEILDFARALFAAPAGALSQDIEQLTSSKTGARPRIIDDLPAEDALYIRLVKDIQDRLDEGVSYTKIAVIAHSKSKLAAIAKAFEGAGIPTVQQNQDNFYTKTAVKLITAHSAKGLEFSEVYIPDANDGVYPYWTNKEIVDADDHAEKNVQDCKLLYVAATRAADRLTIAYVIKPSPILQNARKFAESIHF